MHDVKGVFTVLFDESLNNKLKEKQMDIHVRYWCGSRNYVVTRYMGSEFFFPQAVLPRNTFSI